MKLQKRFSIVIQLGNSMKERLSRCWWQSRLYRGSLFLHIIRWDIILFYVLLIHLIEMLEVFTNAFDFILFDFDKVRSLFLTLYLFRIVSRIRPKPIHNLPS